MKSGTWGVFMKFGTWGVFRISVEKVSFKSNNNEYFT